MPRPVGLIVGTGVDSVQLVTNARSLTVTTPFGAVDYVAGVMNGVETVVLKRHGEGHVVPPHLINYRANVFALYMLGVRCVVTTSAVGSLKQSLPPGSFALMGGFLDFTKARAQTFYETGRVVHTDMTHPYSPAVTKILLEEMKNVNLHVTSNEVYVCAEGPRFESPQEIRMYAMLGGSVVGMTGIPEVTLAREAGLEYQTIAVVTNFAAGINPKPLTHTEVLEAVSKASQSLVEVLWRSTPRLGQMSADEFGEGPLQFLLPA